MLQKIITASYDGKEPLTEYEFQVWHTLDLVFTLFIVKPLMLLCDQTVNFLIFVSKFYFTVYVFLGWSADACWPLFSLLWTLKDARLEFRLVSERLVALPSQSNIFWPSHLFSWLSPYQDSSYPFPW
jgi:hypothetical protein